MIKEGDLWECHGCIYTVTWDEVELKYYFKHPSEKATKDDHIEIDHAGLGIFRGNIR
ncbi:hypothetical protein JOD82_002115 [Paenibacillus sp. 1182]|uniref:hypothetical protein n=1 Tax=Paenibacillus sp. 1182 TaxID=2806565 RepID=UPI001AE70C46|nr:hypothetical protein [Paenibacillus sp. 1182]MBP1309095.1 hypothetical protein [Paenibacillus sp. 1182]